MEVVPVRRPLAVIGFTFLAALVAASFFGWMANAALAVLFAVSAGVALFVFGGRPAAKATALALAAAAAALGWYCAVWQVCYQPAAQLAGQTADVTGLLDGLPQQSGGKTVYVIDARTVTVNGEETGVRTKIRVAFPEALSAKPYDTIAVQLKLSLPSSGAGFDGKTYFRSKGIFLFGKPVSAAALTKNNRPPFMYYALALRQILTGRIQTAVGGAPGGLAAGILIGDTSALPDATKQAFTDTGISHILAVSGTQTSLIAQCLLLLFCALGLRKRFAAPLAAAGVFAFMAITGFSPSVSRAGIMSMIYLGGLLIGRESDALSALAASVLFLCALNPFAASDTGLLLSFSATLGMILLSGRLAGAVKMRTEKLPAAARVMTRKPAGVLCETVGASAFSVPVVMLTFHTFSPVTLLSNLVEVPLSLAATITAALTAGFAPLSFLAFPFVWATRALCAAMAAIADGLAALPFATVSTDYLFVDLFLAFTVCAAALCIRNRGRGASRSLAAACCCFVLVCGILSHVIAEKNLFEVDCLSVGNGSATLLLRGGKAAVIGLSGYRPDQEVESFLRRRGIRSISLLALADSSQATADAANSLLAAVPCGAVLCSGSFGGAGGNVETVTKPASVSLWSDVALVFAPDGKGGLIAAAEYRGRRTLICGGKTVPAAALGPDLLIYNSSVTAAAAKTLSPAFAVAGGASGALYSYAGLTAAGAKVYRTQDGPVRLVTAGGDFKAEQEAVS